VLAVLATAAALYVARPILFPMALGSLLAFALRPVERLISNRTRLPSVATAAGIVALLILVLLIGIFFLSAPATKWMNNAPRQFSQVERKIQPVKESVEGISKAAGELEEMTKAAAKDSDKLQVEVARPTLTSTVLSFTTEAFLEAGITVSLLFLLLAFGEKLLLRIARLAKGHRQDVLLDIFMSTEKVISTYLFNFSLINIGLGTVIGLGLWAIGLPNPILWGVMAACFNFIPYLGLIAGSSIVFFVALVTFESPAYACLAPLIYYVANLIEANAITPMILGKAMQINVIFLFIGILFWGWMWGIGGMLIAVPLMGAIKVICDNVDYLKSLGRLLAGGELPPGNPA